jgi:hypothetical protein
MRKNEKKRKKEHTFKLFSEGYFSFKRPNYYWESSYAHPTFISLLWNELFKTIIDSSCVRLQTTALQSCVWYYLGDGFAQYFSKGYNSSIIRAIELSGVGFPLSSQRRHFGVSPCEVSPYPDSNSNSEFSRAMNFLREGVWYRNLKEEATWKT